jgi:hypothetical protein
MKSSQPEARSEGAVNNRTIAEYAATYSELRRGDAGPRTHKGTAGKSETSTMAKRHTAAVTSEAYSPAMTRKAHSTEGSATEASSVEFSSARRNVSAPPPPPS